MLKPTLCLRFTGLYLFKLKKNCILQQQWIRTSFFQLFIITIYLLKNNCLCICSKISLIYCSLHRSRVLGIYFDAQDHEFVPRVAKKLFFRQVSHMSIINYQRPTYIVTRLVVVIFCVFHTKCNAFNAAEVL